MRIVLIGAVQFSRRALEELIRIGADVAGVCTLAQSTFNADHCDLGATCEPKGIPCLHVVDINSRESVDWIAERKPDVIFCFGWSRLLKEPILSLAPLGTIGFHPAALPRNRGRHPIIWALVLGLRETASTFFFMGAGADDGDILSQRMLAIGEDDDAGSLYEKITACALEQIREFAPLLAVGSFSRIPQEHGSANVWRKRGAADGQIDWRMSAASIRNLVRGLARPYVGAHFLYRGEPVKVWRAAVLAEAAANVEPGRVLLVSEGRVEIKCGEQAIALLETEPAFHPNPGEYL